MRKPALILLFATAACGGDERAGTWPSLAPRPGETSPMVPRTPLGGCAGCGPEVPGGATDVAPPAPPPLQPVPANAATRLSDIATALSAIEKAAPGPRGEAQKAIAAARGASAESDAGINAEVARSRFEAVFLPLAQQGEALEALEAEIAGRDGAEALAPRVAALNDRIAALQALRRSLD